MQIDTSRQLEWLKGVETSHGSVAKSSLLEAQAINEKGVYRVGCLSKNASAAMEKLSLDTVVELSVPQGEKGECKVYTLDDLKDLQSKLMLIAAKASHGKEEVDRFVDVSLVLSSHGITFPFTKISYMLNFSCNIFNILLTVRNCAATFIASQLPG